MQEFTMQLPSKIATTFFYGLHYTERDKLLLEWQIELQKAIKKYKVEHIPNKTNNITFDFYTTGGALSVTDCAGMIYLLIQGMVRLKLLNKDTITNVAQITVIPNKSKRKYSYVVVELD